MRTDDNTWIGPAMDWILDVDVDAARGAVEGLRRKYPAESNRALVERVFATARLKGTASGVVTGLPSALWLNPPAAAVDMAVMLRLKVKAAARAALIYDPRFFDGERSVAELLRQILGSDFWGEVTLRLRLPPPWRIGGALFGVVRNWAEMNAVRDRCIAYFEGQQPFDGATGLAS